MQPGGQPKGLKLQPRLRFGKKGLPLPGAQPQLPGQKPVVGKNGPTVKTPTAIVTRRPTGKVAPTSAHRNLPVLKRISKAALRGSMKPKAAPAVRSGVMTAKAPARPLLKSIPRGSVKVVTKAMPSKAIRKVALATRAPPAKKVLAPKAKAPSGRRK